MTDYPANVENILQASLEAIFEGGATLELVLERYPEQRQDLEPRLETALWLRARRDEFNPRPGFVNASRQRVLAKIADEQASRVTKPRVTWQTQLADFWGRLVARPGLAFQMALVVTLAFVMVLAGSGIAVASLDDIPGDPFYGVKLAVEEVELVLTPSAAGDAELHIEFAERRILEIKALMSEDQYDAVAPTVERYERHIQQATAKIDFVKQRDPARAGELALTMQLTLERQQLVLAALVQIAPPEMRLVLGRAVEITARGIAVSAEIIQEVEQTPPTMRSTLPADLSEPESESPLFTETGTLSPTPTLSATPSATPSPTATPTETPTSTITVTPTPTGTQVPDEPTGVNIEPSPTIAPTAVPPPTATPVPDTPVPEPTEEVKPTKTPKPLPSPTRRPTKES